MTTLQAAKDRYPYTAARLDPDGRIVETCAHDHERSDAGAIACARDLGWDGFAELLVTDDAPARALEVWRFHDERGTTHLQALGVISHADIAARRLWP